MNSDKILTHIGPNPVVCVSFPPAGIAIMFGVFNLLFLHISEVRRILYGILENIGGGHLLISYYQWSLDIHASWLCLLIIIIGFTIGWIAFKTSSYDINWSGDDLTLNLKYGLFVKGGEGDSYFLISSDTRLVSLIADCDYTRSLSDILCGMGTLYIKSANEGDVRVPYVQNPKEAADFLMQHSKVPDARIYSSV